MFQSFTKRDRLTILIYISVFAGLLLLAGISARHVIFKPWTARKWISAVEVTGRIYIFGGLGRGNRVYDDVLAIDLRNNRLIHAGALPSPRFGTASAYFGGAVYVVGGFNGMRYFDEVVRFDLTTRRTEVAMKLSEPRCFGSLVVAGGKLYYIGGWNGKSYTDTILEIDPVAGESRIAGRLPEKLEHHASVVKGNSIFVIGGEGEDRNYRDSVIEIELGSWRVLKRGKLPSPVVRMAGAITEEGIVIAGGWDGSELDSLLLISRKSGRELRVKKLMTLPRGMADVAMVSYDGMLYIVGGTSEKSSRQIGLLRIDPKKNESEDILLKSYSWR